MDIYGILYFRKSIEKGFKDNLWRFLYNLFEMLLSKTVFTKVKTLYIRFLMFFWFFEEKNS